MNKISAIVSVKWLAEKLSTSPKNFRVLDGSWHLPIANRNARAEYEAKHIPGAQFFDIDECADKSTKLSHMLPKPSEFEAYVGKLGISNDTHVVVYDNNDKFPLFSAQRVWWTFRTFGHDKVSVLEGGLRKWCNENNPVTDSVEKVPEEKFKATFRPNLVKNFEDVESNQFSSRAFTLVDARPAGRFEGTAPEPRPDIKSGCIPNSVNLPFMDVMDLERQTFKSKEELQKIFEQRGIDLTKPIIGSCGSGISACLVALAAYVCGKDDVAVYDGSWTEWYQRAKPEQMKNVPAD
ncbi:hypothetical protein BaRGS_00001092 [Batillaria attramentaria]|uniref:Sulfurtransferase n=1 Tax=Batillaria attramentaria TaxID=370345 RepID=A0ABD0M6M4_9CAEN